MTLHVIHGQNTRKDFATTLYRIIRCTREDLLREEHENLKSIYDTEHSTVSSEVNELMQEIAKAKQVLEGIRKNADSATGTRINVTMD